MVVMVVVLRGLSMGGLLLALVAVEVLVVALVAVMLMSPRVCLLLS
jgi:hypothetical protein